MNKLKLALALVLAAISIGCTNNYSDDMNSNRSKRDSTPYWRQQSDENQRAAPAQPRNGNCGCPSCGC